MKYSPFIMLPYELLTWHWDYGYSRFGDLLKYIHFPYAIYTFFNAECQKCTFSLWNIDMIADLGSQNASRIREHKCAQHAGRLPADPRQDRMLGAENVDFIFAFVLFSHPE